MKRRDKNEIEKKTKGKERSWDKLCYDTFDDNFLKRKANEWM